jgi:hypothetical protein
MSLAILGIALGACAWVVQIGKPITGDYGRCTDGRLGDR